MLKIRQVENGFIGYFENGDCIYPDTPEGLQELLYQVIEELGCCGTRYDEKRVRVIIEPGDKYDNRLETIL